MYRIEIMTPNGNIVNMPSARWIGLAEASSRARAYKKRNPKNVFRVVDNYNGLLKMEV